MHEKSLKCGGAPPTGDSPARAPLRGGHLDECRQCTCPRCTRLAGHPMYTPSDLAYLRGKGYGNGEILAFWNRDHANGCEPVRHDRIPDAAGVAQRRSPATNGNAMRRDVERIAREELGITTLATRRRDADDFHDVAVWQIARALQRAYRAGLQASGRRGTSR